MLYNSSLFAQYYRTHGIEVLFHPNILSNWILNIREAQKRPIFVKSPPNIVLIELTNICNLSCNFCYGKRFNEFSDLKRGYIKEKDFKKIVSELSTPVSIGLVGVGEPMLHPQFFDFAKYVAKHHKPSILSVVTNGTFLNEATAFKIIEANITHIYISLDASSSETYAKLKGKDYFNNIIDGIRALIDIKKQKSSKKPIIGLNFVITEENKNEILDFAKLAVSLKVDFIGSLRMPLPFSPECAFIDSSPTTLDRIYKQLIETRQYLKVNNLLVKESIMYHPDTIFNYKNHHGFFCSAPWQSPLIKWDGELTLCCTIFSGNYSFGNILKFSFGKVWNNPKVWDFREKTRESIPPIDWCKRCFG